MPYRNGSEWNEKNEILSLIIFKKLEAEKFPRNKQMTYCREMASTTNLDPTNISAKVSNFKSVAGVNKPSNASTNTIEIYNKYRKLSVIELEKLAKTLK